MMTLSDGQIVAIQEREAVMDAVRRSAYEGRCVTAADVATSGYVGQTVSLPKVNSLEPRVEIPELLRKQAEDHARNVIGTDLSPTAEVGTNAFGGKSTKLSARFDLIDPKAIQSLAREAAQNTGVDGVRANVNVAILNAYRVLAGDDEKIDAIEFVQFSVFVALARDLGTDRPILDHEGGCIWAFDSLYAPAVFRLAEVLGYGAAKYSPNNWRAVPVAEHLNHMLVHLFAYLSGDTQDDHLGHALTRAHMALAVHYQGAPWIIGADGVPCPQPAAIAA